MFSFIVFSVLNLIKSTNSQTSDVGCSASYTWADNSLGQTPCLVAAYLLSQCSTTVIDIPALPVGDHYDPGDTSPCNCNTVVYSLISACADCQAREYDTWSTWSTGCTDPSLQVYPKAIPSGTAVPAWAYLNVVPGNLYNASAALLDSNAPESTPAGFSATATATTSPFPISQSFTTPSPSSTSSSHSNVGAIAGGTVGGVLVIALAAISIVWLIMRKKPTDDYADKSTPIPFMPPIPLNTPEPAPHSGSPQPARFYDPADPSTYPDAVGGMAYPPPPFTAYSATPPPSQHYIPQV